MNMNMKKIKIYCGDLEKMIDEDGCYDAEGSTICQTCRNKPIRKKTSRAHNSDKYNVKT
ncbi:hypothetical protein BMS3Abin09_00333 [bacterium BMS3Abin09]|nr:hypothetical protein BMS3Abin09_00333 [bacterium BMS3Abin09]